MTDIIKRLREERKGLSKAFLDYCAKVARVRYDTQNFAASEDYIDGYNSAGDDASDAIQMIGKDMNNDILNQLKSQRTEQGGLWPYPNLHDEAADTIEALRAENARLREENQAWIDGVKELIALRAARAAMGESDE